MVVALQLSSHRNASFSGTRTLGSYYLYEHKEIMHKRAALALGPKCIRGEAALAGLQARASAPISHGYDPETA